MSEHYGHVAGQRFYGCGGCWGGDPNADVPDKRLSDAELAAITWHAAYECWMLPAVCRWQSAQPELNRRQLIIERFATHPHYDEGQL